MALLNLKQREAPNYALDEHNLLLLGQAGTGRTFVLNTIVKSLERSSKVVAVTATAGIACCLHENATTIQRWSGIGDGRHDAKVIRKVIESNVQYADVRQRVLNTDVLIIDECSMLSKKIFECLNEVCKLKNPTLPFGGI